MAKAAEQAYQVQVEQRELFSRLAMEALNSSDEASRRGDHKKSTFARGQYSAFKAAREIVDHDIVGSFFITPKEELIYEPSHRH